MSSVRFKGVTKRFGDVTALDQLDLDIEDGAFVSLLGPSGSGKSTTLNLLAGLLNSDSGEISIGDRIVNEISPDDRDIAMVFQNYALYPHMTVFENLAFPLRARRRRHLNVSMEDAIREVAEMLGVYQLLERYPKELSGGQQQRVALGRAMVRQPEVFLLDEPLSNLDARLRIQMRSDIKALHKRLNATIVYVTHDQAEAMTLSDKIAVFSQGVLQQYATPSEVYNKPANMFVANFVGDREMNMFDSRVEISNGTPALVTDGLTMVLPGLSIAEQVKDRPIFCGVRMESVELSPDPEAGNAKGQVLQTELSGPDLVVQVRLSRDLELWCRVPPTSGLEEDQQVGVILPPEELHFFDPETRLSLNAG